MLLSLNNLSQNFIVFFLQYILFKFYNNDQTPVRILVTDVMIRYYNL
jgi:hypothetical protein